MPTCRIVIDPHTSDGSKHFVQTALDMYNVAVTGLDEYYPVAIFLNQENGEIAGALLGDIWGAWLHVTYLWVAAPLRRQGYGSQLLRTAEQSHWNGAARMFTWRRLAFRRAPYMKSTATKCLGN